MTMADRNVIKLEEGWDFMKKGITKLKNLLEGLPEQQFSSEEYIMLYTTIYNMCTQKAPQGYSQQLYDRYRESFEEYIVAMVLPAIREKHDEFMLRELVKRWNNHKVMVMWLSHVFNYLDRFFVSRRSLPALKDVGLMCFRNLVYQELKYNVRDAVITLIDREREGEKIDQALMKNVIEIFVEIGMGQMDAYENDFEAPMLQDSAGYYSRMVDLWIKEDSCPHCMQKLCEKVADILKREKERVGNYLHVSSEEKLVERIEQVLLSQYEKQMLEKEYSGCDALLSDDKVEILSIIYRLFSKVQWAPKSTASAFRQHVTNEGTTLVKQAEDAAGNKKEFVRQVIELHDKCMQYVSKCFMNHPLFHKAMEEAFEVFCNKAIAGSTIAELLATLCDNLLIKGQAEMLSDKVIEDMLEKVVKLLGYVNDKDLFAEFYREKLACRLLFDKSATDDHERGILTKLKQRYGGQLTSKIEGMVTDLTLARENQNSFRQHLIDNPHLHPGIDLTVTVLTTGVWPSYKPSGFALPSDMVRCVEAFKEFYQAKTKDRKLTWLYSLGTCNIIGNFESKPIELVVTTYQAAVLLLFNVTDRLSYSDIKGQLNLTNEDIIRVLHSLSCAKYKILNKDPATKTVLVSDFFELNTKFTDKMRRIKVPLPPIDEKEKVIEGVDMDRRYTIDASIVRIMKSHKQLHHQQLLLECIAQLGHRFKPDFKIIEKSIEGLIAQEYLERDKSDQTLLRYLA